jgi:sterol 3beta-glucosyltransferase
LRAGVPSIIFPRAVDQYFWAECVQRLGVGPRPVGRGDFNPAALALLFRRVATDQGMRERARLIGKQVQGEDGIARAVEALHTMLG